MQLEKHLWQLKVIEQIRTIITQNKGIHVYSKKILQRLSPIFFPTIDWYYLIQREQ